MGLYGLGAGSVVKLIGPYGLGAGSVVNYMGLYGLGAGSLFFDLCVVAWEREVS